MQLRTVLQPLGALTRLAGLFDALSLNPQCVCKQIENLVFKYPSSQSCKLSNDLKVLILTLKCIIGWALVKLHYIAPVHNSSYLYELYTVR